jgi:glycosyltransferase involved in cell wall biosynthesis
MKTKILITGPALTTSGYGEQARFALRALRSREDLFDIYLHATTWGQCGWIHEDSQERAWLDSLILKNVQYTQACNGQPQYDMSLQITIPNEWKKITPVSIGYTAGIETNKISPHWIQPSNQMDKILVISNFSKKGFENGVYTAQDQNGNQVPNFKVNTPIEVINYPVRKRDAVDVNLQLTTDFNFLVVAQAGPRKNLANTIKWFVQEFKNDQNVGLVCKTHLAGASQMDREAITVNINNILAQHQDRKCKIYLLHGDMTEQEMAALYTHPKIKALISLSHGEGFGLPIFEAAYYGLPVITTEWSGPTDFMYCPNKEGKVKPHFAKVDFTLGQVQPEAVWNGVIEKETMWAFPVETSAKSAMREVYKNHDRFRGQAKRLMLHVEKEFEESKMYNRFITLILGEGKMKWLNKLLNKKTYE